MTSLRADRGISTDRDELVARFRTAVESCLSNTKLDSRLVAWHNERCRKWLLPSAIAIVGTKLYTTGSVLIYLTLRRVRITILAVEKQ